MNLFRAWWLLVVAGWRNRILRQFRRLKNPRYAVATFVGAAYFFWVFVLQRRTSVRGPNLPSELLPVIELFLVIFGAGGILLAWIFGNERASLSFPEAEVQFFFPSPATRRQLLQFKLLRSLVRTLFSAGISALFFARNANHPWFFAAGAFFGLATLNLHVTVASFFRDSLFKRGVSSFARRVLPVAIFVAIAAFAGWAAWTKSPRPDWSSELTVANWASAFLETKPLSWVLWPIRAPIHVALAQNGEQFLHALPAAFGLLLVHYLWLLSTNVSFEEGAIESAERRTRWLESRRTGAPRPGTPGKKTASWKLKTTGPKEWAIIWKNVIAARRVFSLRVLPSLLILAGVLAATSLLALPRKTGGNLFALGFFCGLAALLLVIIGPASARIDLRHDLPQLDILRAWPLTGAQVMRGEVGGAALVLASLQWLLLIAAYGFTARWHNEYFGHTEKLAALIALMALCPALSLVGLVVQNSAALIFPAWVALDPTQQRGIEVMGQRLLTLFGTWVVLLIAVVPAAVLGGAAGFILYLGFGIWGAAIGAVIAAAALFAEAAAAVYFLGKGFDRFDVTE